MISHGTPYRMWHDLMSARLTLTRTLTQSYGRPQNVDLTWTVGTETPCADLGRRQHGTLPPRADLARTPVPGLAPCSLLGYCSGIASVAARFAWCWSGARRQWRARLAAE
jgi:hypothetical protein